MSRVNVFCELENALDTEIHQSYLDTIYYQSFIIGGLNKLSIATEIFKIQCDRYDFPYKATKSPLVKLAVSMSFN